MRQNFMVKKQHNLTVEGYSIYLRVMKIYEYPPSVILNKKEEFTKESQKLGLKEFLDSLFEDN